jgi:clan AA aspartic protease
MGLTRQRLTVKETHRSRKKAEVDFLIDSGAVYSLAPATVLKRLGIRPHRKVDFSLADGRVISRKVGDAYFEHHGAGGAAPIIFGEVDDEPLLGATALESLGLVLDPFKRRLLPMRMLLASASFTAARARARAARPRCPPGERGSTRR